jgi:hypothetical protein
LAWDPVTDPGLAGYKIYYGTLSRNYSLVADVGNSNTYLVSNLQSGATYYFAATAYDAAGFESSYSNEVSYNASSACTYSISPTNQTFTSSGGTGTINVTTQASCSWAAAGGSWITITSGSYGTGSGTVRYSVSANTGASRTAASTIANKIFTVTQAGIGTYNITASAGTGGSISPSGTVSVSPGASKTFNITPSARYRISRVTVDGASVGAASSYTFTNVTKNHTISATFR